MKELMLRLWREEEGQDLTEYALLLVLIALAVAAVLPFFANEQRVGQPADHNVDVAGCV
jgi:Flp pilus assembly pilin Flp